MDLVEPTDAFEAPKIGQKEATSHQAVETRIVRAVDPTTDGHMQAKPHANNMMVGNHVGKIK